MQAKVPASDPPLRRGPQSRRRKLPRGLIGRKRIQLLEGYLAELRALYPHPNRILFYDDVVRMYLLAFFNPAVDSLRTLEDASQIPGINAFLSVQAVCKSTLAEANALFDPAHLQGLIQSLRADLPQLEQREPELAHLLTHVQLVDGSFFRLASDVAWALQQHRPNGKPLGSVRLNCQLDLATGTPAGISVSGDDGTGEGTAATAFLAPGHLYLFDAGVVSFPYLQAIGQIGSQFLCRLHCHVHFAPTQERALAAPAQAAGILSDRVGHLTGSRGYAPPPRPMREIRVRFTDRQGNPQTLRLLTDLLDWPAELLAQLYRWRWQIELFFRWLKVAAHFEHLTSHSKNGVSLSFHIAVIACLLTCLQTQTPVSKYAYALLGAVGAGQAQIEDILPLLARRQRERARERQRQAARRAAKKAA